MTSKTAADGDDYTWEQGAARRSGVAVFNGAMAPAELAAAGVETHRVIDRLGEYTVTTCTVDLRTPDQKLRELQAEVWRLRNLLELMTAPLDVALRVDNLVDAVEMLTRRVAALEQAAVATKG